MANDIKVVAIFLACHVILNKHRISHFRGGTLVINHHPAKFGGHRHCGSGGMFLVNKEEECSHFNLSLLLSLKYMA